MNNRTLLVLAIVVVVLAAVASAPAWWPSGDDDAGAASGSTARDPLGLAALDADDVTKLVIERPGGAEVAVTRDGNDWKVGARPAQDDDVDAFVSALADAGEERGELVARTAGRHAGLGVSTDAGTVVTVEREGGSAIKLVLGNVAGTGTYYARELDDDRTWLLDGELPTLLPPDATAWQAEPAKATGKATGKGAAKVSA